MGYMLRTSNKKFHKIIIRKFEKNYGTLLTYFVRRQVIYQKCGYVSEKHTEFILLA